MKQEHSPWAIYLFSSGADSDTERELLGADGNKGDYNDMRNGTFNSVGGVYYGVRKLKGESLVYANNLPAGSYQCVAEKQVLQSYHVEVWADRSAVAPSLIRVNGVIVLQSALFPAT